MATAFFPQNFSSSYNNRVNSGSYRSWKGSGLESNPVAIYSSDIRPLTNKDYCSANAVIYKQGSSRPLKIYRRGRSVTEQNNIVRSSVPGRMINGVMDAPGNFNSKNQFENKLNCKDCHGIKFITSYYPTTNMTIKPQYPQIACVCNQAKNAYKMTLPASTNVSKNYFQTTSAYLTHRCKTYHQQSFHYPN
jgi:hypothetical protein